MSKYVFDYVSIEESRGYKNVETRHHYPILVNILLTDCGLMTDHEEIEAGVAYIEHTIHDSIGHH
jgi:hypothetical protein